MGNVQTSNDSYDCITNVFQNENENSFASTSVAELQVPRLLS